MKKSIIVINYDYNEEWMGGTYYIQNLIQALNNLEEKDKPILLINIPRGKEHTFLNLKEITSYPYLERYDNIKLNIFQRAINRMYRSISKRNLYDGKPYSDAIFPSYIYSNKKDLRKQIFWIPDFQSKYLPEFFSSDEIMLRDSVYNEIKAKAKFLVFSSIDSQKDFNQFYHGSKAKQFVLNFATNHSSNTLPKKESVFKKYEICEEYFLCCNQFWKHKNHLLILKAIALMKNAGKEVSVFFTGRENDYRNPNYFSELRNAVIQLGIENNVRFLGFIERNEQIVLIKNSKAVLQPSLFEGWSTVNEDAMAENAYILASNIKVNKEQLSNYPNYKLFNPHDEYELYKLMMDNSLDRIEVDYKERINKFGRTFIEIIENVKSKR